MKFLLKHEDYKMPDTATDGAMLISPSMEEMSRAPPGGVFCITLKEGYSKCLHLARCIHRHIQVQLCVCVCVCMCVCVDIEEVVLQLIRSWIQIHCLCMVCSEAEVWWVHSPYMLQLRNKPCIDGVSATLVWGNGFI